MKIILFLFFFSPLLTNGQTVLKDFVSTNAKEIKSITPADTNYNDFAVIEKAISNSRVVMIGEQDHGDGATFLAKSRLIKYLHEKLGFKILAFESDFYSLNRGWELASNNEYSIDSLIQKNIYPVWTKCNQCSDIFKYLKQQSSTSNSLVISGFDNQLMGSLSQQKLMHEISSFLDTSHLPLFQVEKTKIEFILNISSLLQYYKGIAGKSSITTNTIKSFIATIDTTLNQHTEKYSGDNFYIAVLKSIRGAARQMIAELNKEHFAADQARDEQMAENLIWLINSKYPNEKIIIWAANSHIMKNYFKSSKPPSMGYVVSQKKELKDLTYIIGFTGQSGKSGRISSKPYNISSPAKNSLEQWFNEKQFQYAFVDFKTFNNQHPDFNDTFFMKWIHWQNEKANWTKVFDGVFYIRDMYPCDPN
jgi:erythromycin esterase-like protein